MGRVDIRKIRKDEIVLVAGKLVARKGWQNTTLADIAREAGVSLGVITYHFTNKDELINTVMEKYVGENLAEQFVALEEIEDPLERLKNMIREIVHVRKRDEDIFYVLFDYWAKISWNQEIRDMNVQFFDFARNWTADCIRAGIKKGIFKKVDAKLAATLINAFLLGIHVQHVFDVKAFNFERATKMAEKTILDHLLV
jgi:TetR/AcrR family fatty acid metabolism transcriptional regulator